MPSLKRSKFNVLHLCTPSMLYFIISLVGLLFVGASNLKSCDQLYLGSYKCNVGNNTFIFILHALYILLWTFILDMMCKNGWGDLSWFLFLLPFILIFLFYAMVLFKFN